MPKQNLVLISKGLIKHSHKNCRALTSSITPLQFDIY